MLLSVVIPAYNEEKNIGATIHALASELDRNEIPFEIVVANDNSKDRTEAVLQELSADDARVRYINCSPPNGFGRAIRTGLSAARGDYIVVYMADLSDHPDDVVAYYRKLEEGYDCVFGSRFIEGSKVEDYPRVKYVVNRIVNYSLKWLFWCKFNDLTNAFKGYRREVIEACGPYCASHFNITVEMSLSALIRNYTITQIPIKWSGRTWGESNLRLSAMGRRYMSTFIKVFAERILIHDDVIAEKLSSKRKSSKSEEVLNYRLVTLEGEIQEVGSRLAKIEQDENIKKAA
ncbi:glycosyltransferase family 2 protein [Gimesia maris]|jgi:dolichol-phosphate mannosyltransferase|uniref:Glycosyltransferase CsbB n=1 Tax=Gimesia maris TaxID=122 RepID=A0A3D3REQ2_9PLAN|nr:glycosyltransferase family 2 protein [Gimesia maris]MAC51169.1 glycosyltransferase family 2 protein [Gimesia sp.]HAW31646.1 glycosyltransferase family 2 protein [Planctomycetaceae bacterium]EDL58926.1 Glycosyl transferase, family 2 [Gimesia maris DSM 8797]QDU16708.1 Putative glycosyltransferase CsbB [Gimesia maris]QEG18753.1 Putative glycosyltransferase CsbB [Gimesia maris]|tara:strand:+ start:1137 stop:2006 length:870 start_codon:yes stop_codon:yes gene_type:complete